MKKLPVIGTTAASTTFCTEAIVGPGDYVLWIDGNQKITARNGTYEEPKPNAFSLRNVKDCPGSTPACRASCYVENIKTHAGDLYKLYEINALNIRDILADPLLDDRWVYKLGSWIDNNCKDFRWHVSGDVFSADYAEWLASVCLTSSNTRHWIYTRSFNAAILHELWYASVTSGGPLTINLSCDQDNYAEAQAAADQWGFRLAYMTVDGSVPDSLPEGSVIFPDYSLRPRASEDPLQSPWWQSLTAAQRRMVCPVDTFGKSETHRCGPCKKCLDK